MSDFIRCPKCHKYGWKQGHQCSEFRLWIIEPEGYPGPSEPETAFGKDAEEAVKNWIWEYDVHALEHAVCAHGEVLKVAVLPFAQWDELEEYTAQVERLPGEISQLIEEGEEQEWIEEARNDLVFAMTEKDRLTSQIQYFIVEGETVPAYYVRKPREGKE